MSKTARPLISIKDAAELLGISRDGVDWLIDQGKIDAYTVPPVAGRKGAKRYVPLHQVEKEKAEREATRPIIDSRHE
jgi:excisionase family DNA binding protein